MSLVIDVCGLLLILLRRYDRPCIERWLDQGKTTCPATGQQLAKPMMLTPNISLRNAIEEWAERHQPQLLVRLMDSPVGRSTVVTALFRLPQSLSAVACNSSTTLYLSRSTSTAYEQLELACQPVVFLPNRPGLRYQALEAAAQGKLLRLVPSTFPRGRQGAGSAPAAGRVRTWHIKAAVAAAAAGQQWARVS